MVLVLEDDPAAPVASSKGPSRHHLKQYALANTRLSSLPSRRQSRNQGGTCASPDLVERPHDRLRAKCTGSETVLGLCKTAKRLPYALQPCSSTLPLSPVDSFFPKLVEQLEHEAKVVRSCHAAWPVPLDVILLARVEVKTEQLAASVQASVLLPAIRTMHCLVLAVGAKIDAVRIVSINGGVVVRVGTPA